MITATKAKVSPGKLLIDGKWSEGSGKTFDTFNPASGEVLTQVAEGGASGVDQAVAAARKAFDDINSARSTAVGEMVPIAEHIWVTARRLLQRRAGGTDCD